MSHNSTQPVPLTQYETFAIHCMPSLRLAIVNKLYTHGKLHHIRILAQFLPQGLEQLRKEGYYIHYCHTSPRQIERDRNTHQIAEQHYTVSRRYYPAVGEAPELKVAVVTRDTRDTRDTHSTRESN